MLPNIALVTGKPIKPVFTAVIITISTPASSLSQRISFTIRKETAIAARKNMNEPATICIISSKVWASSVCEVIEPIIMHGEVMNRSRFDRYFLDSAGSTPVLLAINPIAVIANIAAIFKKTVSIYISRS